MSTVIVFVEDSDRKVVATHSGTEYGADQVAKDWAVKYPAPEYTVKQVAVGCETEFS